MKILDKFLDAFVRRGGVLATGVISLFLYKNKHLPEFMGLVSFSITAIGLLGVITNYFEDKEEDVEVQEKVEDQEEVEDKEVNEEDKEEKDYSETEEDSDYEARMAEFYRLKPELERTLLEQSKLALECNRLMHVQNKLLGWSLDSQELNSAINALVEREERNRRERERIQLMEQHEDVEDVQNEQRQLMEHEDGENVQNEQRQLMERRDGEDLQNEQRQLMDYGDGEDVQNEQRQLMKHEDGEDVQNEQRQLMEDESEILQIEQKHIEQPASSEDIDIAEEAIEVGESSQHKQPERTIQCAETGQSIRLNPDFVEGDYSSPSTSGSKSSR